jgi:hypothetical protein
VEAGGFCFQGALGTVFGAFSSRWALPGEGRAFRVGGVEGVAGDLFAIGLVLSKKA